jgi:hypothetical protein
MTGRIKELRMTKLRVRLKMLACRSMVGKERIVRSTEMARDADPGSGAFLTLGWKKS